MSWKPNRGGQWVKLKVAKPELAAKLKELGAHVTADGYFLAVHVKEGRTALVETRDAKGNVVRTGGEVEPARLMLVDERGHNVPTVHRSEDGSAELRSVYFPPDSPNLAELRPLLDKADLPPGYTPAEGWEPRP